MSNQWIDPNQCKSLAVLVESVTAPLLIQHAAPICLEMDIDTTLPVPGDPSDVVALLQTLVNQSLQEMSGGGDLAITACQTAGGLELEVADTGPDVSHRMRRLPMAAASLGAHLQWQNCPQGGAAVTVRFPAENAAKRRAA